MNKLSNKEILQQVALGTLSIDEAEKIMNKEKSKEVKMKVSPKGAISFYGLRKMPITLYAEEYEALIKLSENGEYTEFLNEHESKLSRKNAKSEKDSD